MPLVFRTGSGPSEANAPRARSISNTRRPPSASRVVSSTRARCPSGAARTAATAQGPGSTARVTGDEAASSGTASQRQLPLSSTKCATRTGGSAAEARAAMRNMPCGAARRMPRRGHRRHRHQSPRAQPPPSPVARSPRSRHLRIVDSHPALARSAVPSVTAGRGAHRRGTSAPASPTMARGRPRARCRVSLRASNHTGATRYSRGTMPCGQGSRIQTGLRRACMARLPHCPARLLRGDREAHAGRVPGPPSKTGRSLTVTTSHRHSLAVKGSSGGGACR